MKFNYLLIFLVFFTNFGCKNYIFSNIDYKENIDSEVYLLNKEDVINVLSSDPNKEITQPVYSKIGDDPILLLRFKNNGDSRPMSGVVTSCIEKKYCFEINIYGLGFGNNYTIYSIQLTDFVLPQQVKKANIQPTVDLTWNKLQVK